MSKALFAVVRELVAEKKYAEARIILSTIDDPKAREWEARLNQLDPVIRAPIPAPDPSTAVVFEKTVDWTYLKRAANIFAIIVFLMLSAAAILTYFPDLSPENIGLTAIAADYTRAYETRTAYYVTEIAVQEATERAMPTRTPTSTFTQTPDWAKTQAFLDSEHAIRGTQEMQTVAANRATELTWYTAEAVTDVAIATIRNLTYVARGTNTPTPTLAVTPMSPTTYYVLDGNWLYTCPYPYCRPIREVRRGTSVTVVGIVEGGINSNNTNKWYEILSPDGDGNIYYDFVEWFSPNPPGENEHSIFSLLWIDATLSPVSTPHP